MKTRCLFCFAVLAVAGCNQGTDLSAHGSGGQPSTPPKQVVQPTPPKPTEHAESLNRSFPLKDLQRVTVKVAGNEIPVWVMDTEPKRAEGMMWLVDADVKPNEGMIFAFADKQPIDNGFWMKNTILPLDIIFISQDKKVLNIQEGKPQDLTNLPPSAPYMYVIELKQGTAKRMGITPGAQVQIPDSVSGI